MVAVLQTLTVGEAAGRLAELIRRLGPGDEITLTQDGEPVARIVRVGRLHVGRQPGNCKGMLILHQEDDEHLRDFGEHTR